MANNYLLEARLTATADTAAVDRFTASLKDASDQADRLDGRSVTVSARLDRTEFDAGVQATEAAVSRLDGREATVHVQAEGAAAAEGEIGGVEKARAGLDGKEAKVRARADGTAEAAAELGAVEKARAGVDGKEARVRATAETEEGVAKLGFFRSVLASIGRVRESVRVDVNTARAEAQVGGFKALLSSLGRIRESIRFDVNTGAAEARVGAFKALISSLGRIRESIRVDVNNDHANHQLLETGALVRWLGAQRAHIAVDVDKSKIDAAKQSFGEFAQKLRDAATIGSTFLAASRIPAIIAAIGAIPGVAVAAGAGVVGLGIALGNAAIGFASMASTVALGVGGLKAYEAIAKFVVKQSHDGAFATTQWAASSVEFNSKLALLKGSFQDLVREVGGGMLPVFNQFLDAGIQNLPLLREPMERLVESTNKAALGFLHAATESKQLTNIRIVLNAGAEAAGQLMTIAGNLGLTLVNVFAAANMDGSLLLTTLVGLTTRMREWTASAEGMRTLERVFMRAEDAAVNLGKGILNVTVGLIHIGQAVAASGIGTALASGMLLATQRFRDGTAQGTAFSKALTEIGNLSLPMLRAVGSLVGEAGKQLGLMAQAALRAKDPATGLSIYVEVLNSIKRSLAPLGQMFTQTFITLGPSIARLIPEVAQLLSSFAGATPILAGFLDRITQILHFVNNLPAPLKNAASQALELGSVMKVSGAGVSLLLGALKPLGSIATMTVLPFANLAARTKGYETAAGAAGAAATRLRGQLSSTTVEAGRFATGMKGAADYAGVAAGAKTRAATAAANLGTRMRVASVEGGLMATSLAAAARQAGVAATAKNIAGSAAASLGTRMRNAGAGAVQLVANLRGVQAGATAATAAKNAAGSAAANLGTRLTSAGVQAGFLGGTLLTTGRQATTAAGAKTLAANAASGLGARMQAAGASAAGLATSLAGTARQATTAAGAKQLAADAAEGLGARMRGAVSGAVELGGNLVGVAGSARGAASAKLSAGAAAEGMGAKMAGASGSAFALLNPMNLLRSGGTLLSGVLDMLGGPVMLGVVAGAAALAAGFIYAYNHSERFRSIVDSVSNWLQNTLLPALQTAATWVGDRFVAALERAIDWGTDFWHSLQPLVPLVQQFWGELKTAYGDLQTFADWLGTAKGKLDEVSGASDSASTSTDGYSSSTSSATTTAAQFSTAIQQVADFLSGLDDALNSAQETSIAWGAAVHNAALDVISIFQSMGDAVANVLNGMMAKAEEAGKAVHDKLVGWIKAAKNTIVGNSIIPDMVKLSVGWLERFRDQSGDRMQQTYKAMVDPLSLLPKTAEDTLKEIPAKIASPFERAAAQAKKHLEGIPQALKATGIAAATALSVAGATVTPAQAQQPSQGNLAQLAQGEQKSLASLTKSADDAGADMKKKLLGHLSETREKGLKEFAGFASSGFEAVEKLRKDAVASTQDLDKQVVANVADMRARAVAEMVLMQTSGTDRFTVLQTSGSQQADLLNRNSVASAQDMRDRVVATMTDQQVQGTDQFTRLQQHGSDQSEVLRLNSTRSQDLMRDRNVATMTDQQVQGTHQFTVLQQRGSNQSEVLRLNSTRSQDEMRVKNVATMTDQQVQGTHQFTVLQQQGTQQSDLLHRNASASMLSAQKEIVAYLSEANRTGSAQLEALKTSGSASMQAADPLYRAPVGKAAEGIEKYLNDMLYGMGQVIDAAKLSIDKPKEFPVRLTGMDRGGLVGFDEGGRAGTPSELSDLLAFLKQGGGANSVEWDTGRGGLTTRGKSKLHWFGEGDGEAEGYVVKGRPPEEQLPNLREMASWFDHVLVPVTQRGGDFGGATHGGRARQKLNIHNARPPGARAFADGGVISVDFVPDSSGGGGGGDFGTSHLAAYDAGGRPLDPIDEAPWKTSYVAPAGPDYPFMHYLSPSGGAGEVSDTGHLYGLARGGIVGFAGGGLSGGAIAEMQARAEEAMGYPYIYGPLGTHSGLDGYTCSGLWNHIIYADTGDPQYGTYAYAAGMPGMEPGGGQVELAVVTSGAGGYDDSHMWGDILGTSYESTIPAGVHHGLMAGDGGGAIWHLGDAAAAATGGSSGGRSIAPIIAKYIPEVPDFGKSVPETEAHDIGKVARDALTKLLGSKGGAGSWDGTGSLHDWIVSGFQMSGTGAGSADDVAKFERLAMQESGGDPNITQQIYDVNSTMAGAGGFSDNLARGLLQDTPVTWEGLRSSFGPDVGQANPNIFDPIKNVAIRARNQMEMLGYISDAAGYTNGGLAMKPHLAPIAEHGPELFFPLHDPNAAQGLISWLRKLDPKGFDSPEVRQERVERSLAGTTRAGSAGGDEGHGSTAVEVRELRRSLESEFRALRKDNRSHSERLGDLLTEMGVNEEQARAIAGHLAEGVTGMIENNPKAGRAVTSVAEKDAERELRRGVW